MSVRGLVSRHWPLLAALIIFWGAIVLLGAVATKMTSGHFSYVIDDPYVHMAIAKNVVEHGVWGVTRYAFASASSSLLWPLTLSGVYLLFGVNDWAPFALNFILATLIVCWVYAWMPRVQGKGFGILTLAALLFILFLTPLPALVFVGMEHTLHALLSLAAASFAARLLAQKEGGTGHEKAYAIPLLITAPLLTLVRYEGLLLVFVLCVLFALRKRWRFAFLLGALALAPLLALGGFSAINGSHWLPNPVLLKSHLFHLHTFKDVIRLLGGTAVLNLIQVPGVYSLLVTALGLFAVFYDRGQGMWEESRILILVFSATTLLHLQFASVGWFYRYEAHLVALGLFSVAVFVLTSLSQKTVSLEKGPTARTVAVAVLCMLLFLPLLFRGGMAFLRIPQGTKNIYEQNVQMGLFLQAYYKGNTVALNDVGATTYLAEFRCVDLYGLADARVTELRRQAESGLDVETIRDLVESTGVQIAVLQGWFVERNELPPEWTLVGEWRIEGLASSASPLTLFYAVQSSEKEKLAANLRSFASQLPPDVRQRGIYLEESKVL